MKKRLLSSRKPDSCRPSWCATSGDLLVDIPMQVINGRVPPSPRKSKKFHCETVKANSTELESTVYTDQSGRGTGAVPQYAPA